ncbi:MAG: hypothetical protein HOM71_03180 [Deltaproteobacteria bacterium]|nr:hypothetical protein [Deltaproteobacteria bacterium]MBT4184412.1 hypothetical protein [Deltaproteobacteria bacterium]MBT4629857.1 hypothetical protein [Deltaproteobacteria bacterium]MBT5086483.1 hypothetical protein [Deltaproteobacteria bacterium]MBT5834529.1 hypothetical protein [Deltaproteobacteria bacterium]
MFNNFVSSFHLFLKCVLLFSPFLLVINGCETSLNQKNYLECRQMLEKDRQRVRVGNGFSYNSQSFDECRASARFQTDSD